MALVFNNTDAEAISRKLFSSRSGSFWENRFPIIFHAHDGPAFGDSLVPSHVEFADVRVSVVGPFALGVVVMHDQGKARPAAGGMPLASSRRPIDAADLPPQHQHLFEAEHLRCAVRGVGAALDCGLGALDGVVRP